LPAPDAAAITWVEEIRLPRWSKTITVEEEEEEEDGNRRWWEEK
jgi:hypothetical protein